MSRTVYKYAFGIRDTVELEMPSGAQILHIEIQGRTPCMWALVDTDRPLERRVFCIYGTGRPIERSGIHHIGTFLMAVGTLVWHVFEEDKT